MLPSSVLTLARRLLVVLALTTVGVSLSPSRAEARVSGEIAYSYQQTWQATVRLLRVDLQCPITDRDEEMGFVLFEYTSQGRRYPGSVEVVRTTDARGEEHVRVTVQVPAMPSYVERMVYDRLTRKLREDFGDVRTRRRPTPPEAPAEPSEPSDPSEQPGEPTPPGDATQPSR
ncbi:MAG: hypothetical protein J0L92_40095 [Deltaproteobacteria bacterium]|nr:hypothetical protein [Deltaproteobacteria bacterium]